MADKIDRLTRFQIIIDKSDFKNYISLSLENNHFKVEIINIGDITESDFFLALFYFIRKDISSTNKITIIDPVIFEDETFTGIAKLSNCSFKEEVIFEKCTFNDKVYFSESIFEKGINFYQTRFESKIRFIHSTFNTSAEFQDTTFIDLVDFSDSIFKGSQQFIYTDFLDKAIFSRVIFEKQTQFLYNKVESNSIISFENAKFNQALDISRANFWCKLNFWGAKIVWASDDMEFYQTVNINEAPCKENNEALKRLRESCRIIKNEFTKDNNKIEALEYHKSEMNLYHKELHHKLKSNIKTGAQGWKLIKKQQFANFIQYIFNFFKQFGERITLLFNKYSNHFGTSWGLGLIFTLLITLFFYILFLLSLPQKLSFIWTETAISATFKHFVEFLNITNWSIKPFGIENYNWAYLVLFIGRIFIGYGYYQTIQAFRKYGKN